MSASELQSVRLRLDAGEAGTDGQAELRAVTPAEAKKKALTVAGICWGIALAMLPIPIVHFIAPPLLLLFGPLLGWIVYRLNRGAADVTSGGGPCPKCGAAISLAGRDATWPIQTQCSACSENVSIRKV
jgi:hypothetical protein